MLTHPRFLFRAEGDDGAPPAAPPPVPPAPEPDALAVLIDTLRLQPDVVPELIQGSTAAEVQASVTVARAAHKRIADELARVQAAHIPAGNGGSAPLGVPLTGTDLIAAGLAQRLARH